MGLIRKFITVASGTMMSRLLGFAREMLMAAALGTGPVADAFYAAFQFPNTFRRLFAEGAFNAAFVPLFAKEIEANGMDGAKRFSEEVFGVLFTVLIALTILMELAMPILVATIVAPGFSDDAPKFELTVGLATIMFPYLICMSLAAMMSGMLNSLRRYFAAAVAPVFLNIILVGILAYAWMEGHDGRRVGYALAWGVLAAGVVQLGIVWVAVRHAGVSIRFRRPRFTPNVRRLLWLALPAAITGGITQINQLIGTAIASAESSAVSSLSLADRFYQLPLGVVGAGVAIVLLPELSRALKGGDLKEAMSLQNRSVEFTLFLTLPAAAALFVMAEPIIRVLYERGRFGPESTATVSAILSIFALGLPAFVLIKAFTPGYFAREDTRTPMYFAAISVGINVATALTLFPKLGAPGIAVASAVAGWVNAGLLLVVLILRGHWQNDLPLLGRLARLLIAAIVMAAAIWYAQETVAAPYFRSHVPVMLQGIALAMLVAGAMAVYFAVAFGSGGARISQVKRSIRRSGAAKPPAAPASDEP